MTQSIKFPDAEAVEAGYKAFRQSENLDTDEAVVEAEITAALDSYHNRTGIDLADVSEKLASGEWVLVRAIPAQTDEQVRAEMDRLQAETNKRLSIGAAPFTSY